MSDFWLHIKLLLINPPKAWRAIKKKTGSFKNLLLSRVSLIILAMCVCQFIGQSLSMVSTSPLLFILADSVLFFVVHILAFYLAVYVVNYIVPNYGGKSEMFLAGNLVFYSLTLYYLAMSAIFLFPSLLFLAIVPVYSLFLYSFGARQMFNIPRENFTGFLLVSLLIIIGLHLILFYVLNVAVLRLF